MNDLELKDLAALITEARQLARQYYRLTGRPLGITGEVAEFEAARLLDLDLCPARQAGYDAVGRGEREGRLIQIKGRCILDDAKTGQRLGSIKLDKPWDVVLLVLLDGELEPFEIHEADRPSIEAALLKPGSRARNERGALSVAAFKRLGRLVWSSAQSSGTSEPARRQQGSDGYERISRVAATHRPQAGGGQDAASGSLANAFGHQMARLVGRRLGLEFVDEASNKFRGALGIGVIKSARAGNNKIGVSKSMAQELDVVIGVLEDRAGTFHIYEVSRANFEAYKYEPASTKSSHLWFLDVRDIQRVGDLLDSLRLSDIEGILGAGDVGVATR